MTNEERDIISQFIARVGGASQQSVVSVGSGVPTQPALPPIDRDADALIAQMFAQYPEARYRITQLAFVQEHALVEAQNRIKRLEWELQQAQQAAQQAQQSTKPRGIFQRAFRWRWKPTAAGTCAGRSAVGRAGGTARLSGWAAATAILPAGGPAAAAISAQLSAGHVSAARRLGVPRVSADDSGWGGRWRGRWQCAHEPVFAASGCWRRIWWRRIRWRAGGQSVGYTGGTEPGLR